MKFNKKAASKSEISTASMPDIVFLLLFFFMVSATIKQPDEQVKVEIPEAHALTKVQKQFLIKELHVGKTKDISRGSSYKISVGSKIIQLSEIGHWVETQRASLDEQYKDQMIILLKADINVDMGLITDIQQELRKHNARKILYRTWEVPVGSKQSVVGSMGFAKISQSSAWNLPATIDGNPFLP